MPGYATFDKKYQDKYKIDIRNYAAFTYDAVMKKAGSTEPAK